MNELIWILPLGLLAFLWFRGRGASKAQLQALVDRKAQKVDVRTPGEFAGGHAPGCVNIPLDQLAARAKDLDKARPVLLCCASGSRSAMATSLLKAKGFEAVNAGPWGRLAQL
ncbi:MAG TPA: rhodanese-like domain-containing protein [Holophagaceae bacterium]|nr:rhodanese-like domain-containing protein [Holophagaceae bacterium]